MAISISLLQKWWWILSHPLFLIFDHMWHPFIRSRDNFGSIHVAWWNFRLESCSCFQRFVHPSIWLIMYNPYRCWLLCIYDFDLDKYLLRRYSCLVRVLNYHFKNSCIHLTCDTFLFTPSIYYIRQGAVCPWLLRITWKK